MSACEVLTDEEIAAGPFPTVRGGLVIDYRPAGSRRWERLKNVSTRTIIYHQCWWFGAYRSSDGDYRVNRSTAIDHPGRATYAALNNR